MTEEEDTRGPEPMPATFTLADITEWLSNRDNLRAWFTWYAYCGTPEEQAANVECILTKEFDLITTRADMYAGAQFEPGPKAFREGIGFALSEMYECHTGPHTPQCPEAPGNGYTHRS